MEASCGRAIEVNFTESANLKPTLLHIHDKSTTMIHIFINKIGEITDGIGSSTKLTLIKH